jgi:ssDNA-specific exonuclease RecJ
MTSDKRTETYLSLCIEHGSFIKPSAQRHHSAKVFKAIVPKLIQSIHSQGQCLGAYAQVRWGRTILRIILVFFDSRIETASSSVASRTQYDEDEIKREFGLPSDHKT